MKERGMGRKLCKYTVSIYKILKKFYLIIPFTDSDNESEAVIWAVFFVSSIPLFHMDSRIPPLFASIIVLLFKII